jgi:hypothetical protein
VKEKVRLHVKLSGFSWDHSFKILDVGPFSVILGLDFLSHTRMILDMDFREYYFSFAPAKRFEFEGETLQSERTNCSMKDYSLQLQSEMSSVGNLSSACSGTKFSDQLVADFPELFTGEIGTSKNSCYEIELVDKIPVRSPPYRFAPPKAKILKKACRGFIKTWGCFT